MANPKFDECDDTGLPVNPWISLPLDPQRQTGGDWYLVMLSASIGFKAIHGANTTPTCEVLCKGSSAEESLTGHGVIRWDPHTREDICAFIGDRISDRFYLHHQYRGTITSSGSVLAYESGLWEPSSRKRAKSSALLAASIYAHGGERGDAIATVRKITGDDIDEEAVESAILPASHLKREMVLISKANHRVFSQGTIQCGVIWDDRNLGFKDKSKTMAFDWGRVTAVARSIAEGNVQNCPKFRYVASKSGVPYGIVKNAWAYVTDTDYLLTASQFSSVPDIDASRFMIPSLKGSFVGHEHDVMLALTRDLSTAPGTIETDAFTAYRNLHAMAKKRLANRKSVRTQLPSYATENVTRGHTITGDTIPDLLLYNRVVTDSLVKALASRRKYDVEFRNVLAEYRKAIMSSDVLERDDATDSLSRVAFSKPTWVFALKFAEESIKESGHSEDMSTMITEVAMAFSNLKETLIGYPTHLTSDVPLMPSTLVRLRPYIHDYISQSCNLDVDMTASQRSMIDYSVRETAAALAAISSINVDKLTEVRQRDSKIYLDWFRQGLACPYDSFKYASTRFAYAGYGVKYLEASAYRYKASGYMDGAAPRKSYVYQCTKFVCSELGIESPRPIRLIYSGALSLAEELEKTSTLPFSIVEGVKYAIDVLDRIVSHLLIGEIYVPKQDEYNAVLTDNVPLDSPAYDTSMMEQEEMENAFLAMMWEHEAIREESVKDPYSDSLNTYPTASLAEEYAKANGYTSYRAAFGVLGSKASYYEGNEFVIKAKMIIAVRNAETMDVSKKRGYGSII